jgi:CubicO group peptidase (beta-lactamase class C family)
VAAVLTLREYGLPLSTRAIELLPELRDDWWADPSITVEQLLGQVAGLVDSVGADIVSRFEDADGVLMEAARLIVRAGSRFAPGDRWSYYNGNYFLVGAIIEAVTGRVFEDVLAETVLRPWSLHHTGFSTPADPMLGHEEGTVLPVSAYPRARRPSGGLWSCVADLLSFAEQLMADEQLLSETRRHQTAADDPMTCGLGWAIGNSGQMFLNGRLAGYRAAVLTIPDQRYASVALSNDSAALSTIATALSHMQESLTGDDLAAQINNFAA